MTNIHPGEILQEEFLTPLGMTAYKLSKLMGVQQTRISEILKDKRSVSVDTAERLASVFGNTPAFWLNLQTRYDLISRLRLRSDKFYK